MNHNPFVWVEIYVQDMPRAKAFYEKVFGFTLSQLQGAAPGGPEMWGLPMEREGTGAAGALVRMPGVASGGGGTLAYFHCDDCASQEAKVKSAGGKVHKPKFSIGQYGFISLVVDTEGNMIGLHSLQ
jgi:predicted enzyme related to lactoylglutathione lyase